MNKKAFFILVLAFLFLIVYPVITFGQSAILSIRTTKHYDNTPVGVRNDFSFENITGGVKFYEFVLFPESYIEKEKERLFNRPEVLRGIGTSHLYYRIENLSKETLEEVYEVLDRGQAVRCKYALHNNSDVMTIKVPPGKYYIDYRIYTHKKRGNADQFGPTIYHGNPEKDWGPRIIYLREGEEKLIEWEPKSYFTYSPTASFDLFLNFILYDDRRGR